MTRDTEEEALQKPDTQDASGSVDARRRRLLTAGVSSSLLLTIASRPAWAQGGQCTASALTSANASGGHDDGGCSISAGWWKNNLNRWPIDSGTLFGDVFLVPVKFDDEVLYSGKTLGEVIVLNGGNDPIRGKLGFFLVGALLNALEYPPSPGVPGFKFTAQEVKDLYYALDGAPLSSFQTLAGTLDDANNEYDNVDPKPW